MLVDNFLVLENVVFGVEDSVMLVGGLLWVCIELKCFEDEYELCVDLDVFIYDLFVGL